MEPKCNRVLRVVASAAGTKGRQEVLDLTSTQACVDAKFPTFLKNFKILL
jgi:hypothetical protein